MYELCVCEYVIASLLYTDIKSTTVTRLTLEEHPVTIHRMAVPDFDLANSRSILSCAFSSLIGGLRLAIQMFGQPLTLQTQAQVRLSR